MFTSGTTGRSKGVMLSQKNLFSAMPAFLDPFDDVKKYTGWNTDEDVYKRQDHLRAPFFVFNSFSHG